MLARKQGDSGKNSEQPHHQTRLAERLRDHRVHRLRRRNSQAGIHFPKRGLHQPGDRIYF